MPPHPRIVLDTNILVSALLAFDSTPGQAVRHAMHNSMLLASTATIAELQDVLLRPKFARLISLNGIEEFLASYSKAVQLVPTKLSINICRDPRDDKFLQLAVDGHADVIVSGDADLLSLNPFQGIRVLTPKAFLADFGA